MAATRFVLEELVCVPNRMGNLRREPGNGGSQIDAAADGNLVVFGFLGGSPCQDRLACNIAQIQRVGGSIRHYAASHRFGFLSPNKLAVRIKLYQEGRSGPGTLRRVAPIKLERFVHGENLGIGPNLAFRDNPERGRVRADLAEAGMVQTSHHSASERRTLARVGIADVMEEAALWP